MADFQHRANFACETDLGTDPASFLAYFTELGGGYWLTPDGELLLGVLQTNAKEANRRLAAQLMRQIGTDDAQRIKNHITARLNGDDQTRVGWTQAMRRHTIALHAYEAIAASASLDDHEADRLCDIENDIRWELIGMPAPDRPALLWKLEYLFQGSSGSLDPYNIELLAQTLADCRRLLVEG
ncbi:hypothetical protein [Novosphingobium sp. CECT 9465]|uniref:hypothetical protein n=1 Tax=Novosphingobium sp. CECT 9465 TaxID=2829794 RepID=UPI001E2F407A|nr:hypothetical protein [Novosphingobium sp. CECT 9465]CAH0496622.1 hypothetical protein NVSP9465_01659 [Novosphingobium sp. CECT 9465]